MLGPSAPQRPVATFLPEKKQHVYTDPKKSLNNRHEMIRKISVYDEADNGFLLMEIIYQTCEKCLGCVIMSVLYSHQMVKCQHTNKIQHGTLQMQR